MSRRHSPQQNRGRSPLVKRASASLPAPTVSAITPNSGTTTLVKTITDLAGTGFVNGATVTIGGVAATSVAFVSSTKLTCVGPTGTAGAKDVVVTNPDAQTGTGTGLFTYVAFPTITALRLRLESDIGLTTSSGNVTTWVDQSSRADSYTAAGAARPTEVTNQVNGLSAIRADGAANVMTSTASTDNVFGGSGGSTTFKIVAVMKNTSAAVRAANGYAEPVWVSGSTGYFAGLFGNVTEIGSSFYAGADAPPVRSTQTPGALIYVEATLTVAASGTVSIQVGTAGTPATLTGVGAVGASGTLRLLSNYNGSAWAKGDLFAIYGASSMSAGEITNLKAWINAKYGPGL